MLCHQLPALNRYHRDASGDSRSVSPCTVIRVVLAPARSRVAEQVVIDDVVAQHECRAGGAFGQPCQCIRQRLAAANAQLQLLTGIRA